MRSALKKIILLLVCMGGSFAVRAEGYHVELVVFENLHPVADGEISQTVTAYPDYSNSIEPGSDNPFRLLSSALYKLDTVYSRLKTSGVYRPLLHLAWQQPVLAGERAKAVHVMKSEDAGGEMLVKLDGTVRVRAAQFLHVDVDLLYFIDAFPQSLIQPAVAVTETGVPAQAKYARLREVRRMKLNELHYFDHPLFGMLLYISRAAAQ